MAGLYDRLNAHVNKDEPTGITPLDITDLPADQKQILLWLLRDQGGTPDGVTRDSLNAKFSDKLQTLDETLTELSRKGWLIEMGEPPNQRYRINLRAKRGSGGSFGLWSVLSDRISQESRGSGK
jgi:hypothetical protein